MYSCFSFEVGKRKGEIRVGIFLANKQGDRRRERNSVRDVRS